MWTTPHRRRGTRTLAMETNRTVAEREPAKLNELSALDPRRTHHRLVDLLTTAMVLIRDARNAVTGSRADAGGEVIPPMRGAGIRRNLDPTLGSLDRRHNAVALACEITGGGEVNPFSIPPPFHLGGTAPSRAGGWRDGVAGRRPRRRRR
jgi:hypothetical protein